MPAAGRGLPLSSFRRASTLVVAIVTSPWLYTPPRRLRWLPGPRGRHFWGAVWLRSGRLFSHPALHDLVGSDKVGWPHAECLGQVAQRLGMRELDVSLDPRDGQLGHAGLDGQLGLRQRLLGSQAP